MVSDVGFSYQGRAYTPQEPCAFTTRCMPADFDRWAFHAGEWVSAVAARATTSQQREAYRRVSERYAKLLQDNKDCGFLTCTSATRAMVSISELSKALADSWGEPVSETEVEADWGWISALHLPLPNLPGIGDLEQMIRGAVLNKYLPVLGVVAALWLLNSGGRGCR